MRDFVQIDFILGTRNDGTNVLDIFSDRIVVLDSHYFLTTMKVKIVMVKDKSKLETYAERMCRYLRMKRLGVLFGFSYGLNLKGIVLMWI